MSGSTSGIGRADPFPMGKALAAAVVTGALALMVSTEAAAADAEEANDTHWYGWQTLAVDAAAATTMVVGVATAPKGGEGAASLLLPTRLLDEPPKSTTTLDIGLALYTAGPAIVHAAHGRPLQSIGSAAIRAAGPTTGLVVGFVYGLLIAIPVAVVAPGPRRGGGPDLGKNGDAVLLAGMASGVALGTVGPIVIDAVAFAHEPVAKAAKETPKDATAVTVEPRLAYSKNGPTVGLSGTF